ncbi:MAG: AI-2E family transporter [Rickettsiaceae bacterium]
MNKMASWGIIILIISSIIYIVSDVLAPFLIALIFAYLLQPVIETARKRFSLSRNVCTLGIFFLFLGIFILIMVLIIPVIYSQFTSLVNKLPQYKYSFNSLISSWSDYFHNIDPDFANKVTESAHSFVNSTIGFFASFADHIWQYTVATINFFTIIALVPILLYYFLRDWPKMVGSIESVLPVKGKSKVREILNSINELLSAYIRGQLNICVILTFYYVIGLTIIGLDLALILGVMSGFLIIIPFVGALISFLLVIISCYFSFGTGIELVYVTILFIVGHTVEGYVLAPKIIGDKIGLHPVWIIFAAFAAANLFGFVGILFAIPIAGILKVCLSHLIDYYKSSNIYKN